MSASEDSATRDWKEVFSQDADYYADFDEAFAEQSSSSSISPSSGASGGSEPPAQAAAAAKPERKVGLVHMYLHVGFTFTFEYSRPATTDSADGGSHLQHTD